MYSAVGRTRCGFMNIVSRKATAVLVSTTVFNMQLVVARSSGSCSSIETWIRSLIIGRPVLSNTSPEKGTRPNRHIRPVKVLDVHPWCHVETVARGGTLADQPRRPGLQCADH